MAGVNLTRRAVVISASAAGFASPTRVLAQKLPVCDQYSGEEGNWTWSAGAENWYIAHIGGELKSRSGLVIFPDPDLRPERFVGLELLYPSSDKFLFQATFPRYFAFGGANFEFTVRELTNGSGKRIVICRDEVSCEDRNFGITLTVDGTEVAEQTLRLSQRDAYSRIWARPFESVMRMQLILKREQFNQLLDAGSLTASVNDVDGFTGQAGFLMAADFKLQGLPGAFGNADRAYFQERDRFYAQRCDPDSGVCFLTTACCDHLGLPDDCWELQTLRRFRDDVLYALPGGAEDIATYYEKAPVIVERLRVDPDRSSVLDRIYARHILPSAQHAIAGDDVSTRRVYTSMMLDLSQRYGVKLF